MPEVTTLERSEVLDRIAAALDAAMADSGQVLVIEGQAGIGKTHLVRAVRAMAKERGFGRLQATGDEVESTMAWGVVRQMVERSISRYSGDARDAILAGPTGKALEALDMAPMGEAGDAEIARTLHALWWVAVDLSSSRPLLITVDDAQWSDLPSLRFLSYLSRRVADLPILLVVATRPPTEPTGPLVELTVARSVERLLPQALSREAVGSLSTARSAPAGEVVTAIHEATGGNPFLTGALLDELAVLDRSLSDPGTAEVVAGLAPSTVSRAMLGRLSPDALQLAGAVAVLGAGCSPFAAARLVELEGPDLASGLDELVKAHVLRPPVESLRFVHPVVREAVLAAVGPIDRAELHAAAARLLYDEGAPADRVAAQLAAAPRGTLENAADLYRAAARHSLAAGDTVTAADYLSRAYAEEPSPAVRSELGQALLRAGDARGARPHLQASAATVADDQERATLLAAVASATSVVDGPGAALDELERLLEQWDGDDTSRLVLEARLGVIRSFIPSERVRASAHLRAFADLPGTTSDERTLLALLAQRGRYELSPHDEVAAIASRALADGALYDDSSASVDAMVGWVLAVMALIAADGVDAAREEIDRARARVRAHGSPVDFAMVANADLFLAFRRGDMRGIEAAGDAMLAAIEHEEVSPPILAVRNTAVHFSTYADIERGDFAAGAARLDGHAATIADAPSAITTAWLHEPRARVALGLDDPARALAEAHLLRQAVTEAHIDAVAVPWRATAAVASARLDDVAEAIRLADEHLALAQHWGAPSDVGFALRLVALVDPDRRLEVLQEAVTVLATAPARLEYAKALIDLGEAMRVVRRRADAREPLVLGGDIADSCGSVVQRQRAATALAALGDRPRKLVSHGPDSLTASERRVAELAVSGRPNRDIAQELFVSPKTVENHLGRIYVKLGISGRRQLATALT